MAIVNWTSGKTKQLTILSGATESDILDLGPSYRRWDMTVIALATSHTGAVTPFVSNSNTTPGNFRALQSGGSDVVLTANKATSLIPLVSRFLKLVSAAAEAADRDFIVMAN